jgi:hypothetical protein
VSTFQPPGAENGPSASIGDASTKARLQGRGLVAVDGALALISVLLIVQMWLVTAALESFLAGHYEVAVPAAVISGLVFAACAGLYYFVDSLDADVRRR